MNACQFCGEPHRPCNEEFCYCNNGSPAAAARGEGYNPDCWLHFEAKARAKAEGA